jgi:hypothetical protein
MQRHRWLLLPTEVSRRFLGKGRPRHGRSAAGGANTHGLCVRGYASRRTSGQLAPGRVVRRQVLWDGLVFFAKGGPGYGDKGQRSEFATGHRPLMARRNQALQTGPDHCCRPSGPEAYHHVPTGGADHRSPPVDMRRLADPSLPADGRHRCTSSPCRMRNAVFASVNIAACIAIPSSRSLESHRSSDLQRGRLTRSV